MKTTIAAAVAAAGLVLCVPGARAQDAFPSRLDKEIRAIGKIEART